jgi:hypothetical protein
VNSYVLSEENKKREEDIIKAILLNSGYPINKEQSHGKPKPPKTILWRITQRNKSHSPTMAQQCER